MTEAGEHRLEFRGVCTAALPPYEGDLTDVSFALRPGELIVLQYDSEETGLPLADAAQGLLAPARGEALHDGRAWPALTPDEAAAARARIGRVFGGAGWLSNLTVDENIALAPRYHAGRSAEEVVAEADALARRFGLDGLPRLRPALLRRRDLRRAEWARAFRGGPGLVLLDNPLREVPGEFTAPLVEVIREACARGAGVVWMAEAYAIPEPVRRLAAATHVLRNGRLDAGQAAGGAGAGS